MPAHRWRTADKTSPAARERKRQYNSREYKQARAASQRQVNAGNANCWRCGKHIAPGAPFHLGHDDDNRSIIRGPECPPCNLRAAARKGNAISRGRRTQQTTPRRRTTWHSQTWT